MGQILEYRVKVLRTEDRGGLDDLEIDKGDFVGFQGDKEANARRFGDPWFYYASPEFVIAKVAEEDLIIPIYDDNQLPLPSKVKFVPIAYHSAYHSKERNREIIDRGILYTQGKQIHFKLPPGPEWIPGQLELEIPDKKIPKLRLRDNWLIESGIYHVSHIYVGENNITKGLRNSEYNFNSYIEDFDRLIKEINAIGS